MIEQPFDDRQVPSAVSKHYRRKTVAIFPSCIGTCFQKNADDNIHRINDCKEAIIRGASSNNFTIDNVHVHVGAVIDSLLHDCGVVAL